MSLYGSWMTLYKLFFCGSRYLLLMDTVIVRPQLRIPKFLMSVKISEGVSCLILSYPSVADAF